MPGWPRLPLGHRVSAAAHDRDTEKIPVAAARPDPSSRDGSLKAHPGSGVSEMKRAGPCITADVPTTAHGLPLPQVSFPGSFHLYWEIEGETVLPNSFHEADIALTPRPGEDNTQKGK